MTSLKTPVTLLALLAFASAALAAEPPEAEVPSELAPVLAEARSKLQEDPDAAVAVLTQYAGPDHALRRLLLGHAQAYAGRPARAEQAYRAALELNPELAEAKRGLARVCAEQQKWREACTWLGATVDPQSASADWLGLYAHVARQLQDSRLCRILVDVGVRRFPSDLRFRKLDLALLIEQDAEGAGAAAMFILREEPLDQQSWRRLAQAHRQRGALAAARVALQAAALVEPGNLSARRELLVAQLAAGDWPTVLRQGRRLLAGLQAEAVREDVELMELLIRAADAGERDDLLGSWLQAVPEGERTRAMRIAEARSKLRQGGPAEAFDALEPLIEQGGADASVFLWAGHLAEQADQPAVATALYEEARTLGGPSGRIATLYLARLQHEQGRAEAALELVRAYLREYPEDTTARALLHAIDMQKQPDL